MTRLSFSALNSPLCYSLGFAAVAAVIVHVALYHGPQIKKQFMLAHDQEDVSYYFPTGPQFSSKTIFSVHQ